MPSYTTKEDIDDAVRLRHPEWLAKYITDDQLPKEVRQHLAEIIEGLFTGRIKLPRGRVPQRDLWYQKKVIAEQVWRVKKSNGYAKIGSAIDHVAKELKCSPRKVWNFWRGFNPIAYEEKLSDMHYDALRDEALEARAESALEWLKENEGDRGFSDEEIEAADQKLDEDLRDWDDY
jgi:hypothetical protein